MNTSYLDLPSARATENPAMLGVINYLDTFLAQPHPALQAVGRPGNVCPFTRMALETNSIRFGRQDVDVASAESLANLKSVLQEIRLGKFFTDVEQIVADRRLASLLILVDGPQSPGDCHIAVSAVQKDLQPDFVESRLLMSELHPHNRVPSLHSPDFFPSGAVPHPIFFIRKIISKDIPFLAREDRYPPETVARVRGSLVEQFGEDVVREAMRKNY